MQGSVRIGRASIQHFSKVIWVVQKLENESTLGDPILWGTVAFLLNYVPILGTALGVLIFFSLAC